ncbi:major facilitator superfamily domain-containing protein [Podospora fimiseda]|uniref:Major facilitator superfamily domain-containing protein n=1 Tax=Podospora fimiseda TaxID=252190 RepID=A0AAN7H362_9PEZI|nr:major facilitator superfamily domain-containing protein [Podospora fimiseda]
MTIDSDRRHLRDDSPTPTSSVTATEGTPLLSSEVSSITIRDVSPSSVRSAAVSDSDDEQPPLGWKRGTCIIFSMWVLIFLQASNMSGISTTQSTIATDLNAYEYAMWFTSSYMISMSSTAPLIGRLSMIFSPGIMLLTASLCFSLGAVISSTASTFFVFISGRVLCGIGSGGIMTLCMILVIQLTSKRKRGLWIGLVNAGFTVGVSFGAVVFGALLPVIGWRWLFASQSPLALLAGTGLYLSLPVSEASSSGNPEASIKKVDYLGALALTATITLLLYSLSNTFSIWPMVFSGFTFMGFLYFESTHPKPIIPLGVLGSRPILLSCLAQLGFMAARWTVLFYAPIFVLAVRGLSPAIAGSVLIPTNLGFGAGGLIVGALHIKRAGSFWGAAVLSLFFFGVALLALGFESNTAAKWEVYVGIIFVNGLFTGAALNYSLAHLLHVSEPEMHFIVTGLLATFRGFAGSFGTAVGGGVFGRTLKGALREGFELLDGGMLGEGREKLITVLGGSPAKVWEEGFLTVAERDVAVWGYEKALEVLYKSAAGICVMVLAMQLGTGWTAPVVKDEEEIEEALMTADPRMEV